ncbi:MAG: adenine nucleotide alpha hydrolase [Acidobacteria bacterium]|nr:adenine nucleotide alpha hydrolase [Acidobacteriota bacterium]
MTRRVLLSWSSGKDCAWTLHVLRQQAEVELVGLLTTYNEANNRVSMHAVRKDLVEKQAAAAGLPLWTVGLPSPCSNEEYEGRMRRVVERALAEGVTDMAFGDLFLGDVRQYREDMLSGTGIEPMFPVWCAEGETPALAREMLNGGLRGVLTCVDPSQLDGSFVGRDFDEALLEALPPGVDPCGERGEFHTFCSDGPMFEQAIPVKLGEILSRDGFRFADVLPG